MSAQDSEDASRVLADRGVVPVRKEWSGVSGEVSARRNQANTAAVVHDVAVEDWIAPVTVSRESLLAALDSHDEEHATFVRTGRDLVAVVSEDEREIVAGDPGETGRVAVDATVEWLEETDAGVVKVIITSEVTVVVDGGCALVSLL